MSNELIDDYTNLSGPDFLTALGVDARKWADAFMQLKAKHEGDGDQWIDESLMIGWFANAMMAMHDHLHDNPILNGDHAQYLLDKERGL